MSGAAHHGLHDRPEVQAAMRRAITASRKRADLTPQCAAGCGVPLDPVLTGEGWVQHPACEFPPRPWPRRPRTDESHRRHWAAVRHRNRKANP